MSGKERGEGRSGVISSPNRILGVVVRVRYMYGIREDRNIIYIPLYSRAPVLAYLRKQMSFKSQALSGLPKFASALLLAILLVSSVQANHEDLDGDGVMDGERSGGLSESLQVYVSS